MDEISALAEQQTELSNLLAPLDDDGWSRPSRCEGWSVADVVLHLAQTNEMAVGSARGRFTDALAVLANGVEAAGNVDDAADLMVRQERGLPVAALLDRWRQSADTLIAALTSVDPHDRVDWVERKVSVRTLTTTRLAETWIHTGDVADALEVALVPAERLRHVARLAWRTLPYAFTRAGRELTGPVAFVLEGPSGAAWTFVPDHDAATTIRGHGVELCLVAARRLDPAETGLEGEGPDATAVLELVRTYA